MPLRIMLAIAAGGLSFICAAAIPVATDDSYTVAQGQTLSVHGAAPVTSLTMTSDPGDYIGQGKTYSFGLTGNVWTAYYYDYDNSVQIALNSADYSEWWYLSFCAPGGVPLKPGVYNLATRYPFQASTEPGLSVDGDGRGSNQLTGQFTIADIVYGPSHTVQSFNASFIQHSEGNTPALRGTVMIQYAQATGVLLNDTVVGGAHLNAVLVSGPSHGAVNLLGNGGFDYTPYPNFNGNDSFTYKATTGSVDSNIATVNISVTPASRTVIARNHTYAVATGNTLTVGTSGSSLYMTSDPGDYVGQGQTWTYTDGPNSPFFASVNYDNGISLQVNSPEFWFLDFSAPFNVPLAPGTYYNATRFPFQLSTEPGLAIYGDGRGDNEDFGSFMVKTAVYGPQSTVTAFEADFNQYGDQSNAGLHGTIKYHTVPTGILVNDTWPAGAPAVAELVTPCAHGTLNLNADGSFTYVPTGNFTGFDSFTYDVRSYGSVSAPATVYVGVSTTGILLLNDSGTTSEGAALVRPLVAAAVSGNPLSFSLLQAPAHGSVQFDSVAMTYTYTPMAYYNGGDTFTVQATDGAVTSTPATVTVTVTEVNDPPIPGNDSIATTENAPVSVNVSQLLGNDSPGPNEASQKLTFVSAASQSARGGSVSVSNGIVTYTPAPHVFGIDTFSYTIQDNGTTNGLPDPKQATGTVTVAISEINDPPVPQPDMILTERKFSFSTSTLTANDSPGPLEDAQTLTVTAVTTVGTAGGTLVLSGNNLIYTPPSATFKGNDVFTYTVTDNGTTNGINDFKSAQSTVTIVVTDINDPPTANQDVFETFENTTLTIAPSALLANDSPGPDADEIGQTLQVVGVAPTSGAGGKVSMSFGSIIYHPPANYYGIDSFTYTIQDNGLTNGVADPKQATGTVTVIVHFVNKLPVAQIADSSHAALSGVPVVFDGSGSSDSDGSVAAYLWDFGDGSTGSGKKPTHPFAAPGVYTVTLTVTDNLGAASLPVTVQITVNPFSATDTDGDNYPDAFETAAGTDPDNANSKPDFGVVAPPTDFSVSTFTLKLAFLSTGKDSLTIAGTLPGGVAATTSAAPFVCGNYYSVLAAPAVKISKPSKKGTPFKLTLSNTNLASYFGASGLVNETPKTSASLNIFLIAGGVMYQSKANVNWSVKRGTGTATLAH